MPLDTIGLYNKLEMARERAKNTRGLLEHLFSQDSLSIAVTSGDVIPKVKGLYNEAGRDLLFTVWTDPLDVELVTSSKPEPGTAILAAHDDDLNDLSKVGILISTDKLKAARGYPKWRFIIIKNGTLETLMNSVRSLLLNG